MASFVPRSIPACSLKRIKSSSTVELSSETLSELTGAIEEPSSVDRAINSKGTGVIL